MKPEKVVESLVLVFFKGTHNGRHIREQHSRVSSTDKHVLNKKKVFIFFNQY